MKTIALSFGILAFTTIIHAASGNWPAWRGPLANGFSPDAEPPLEWSETKNVKWKVAIPGQGTATPVIWGDRVFILTAVAPEAKSESNPPLQTPQITAASTNSSAGGTNLSSSARGGQRPRGGAVRPEKPTEKFQFIVLCLDRNTGKVLWKKTAAEEIPHEGHHGDHGFASASPVTDGKHVYAYFGSRGLHCYDMDGNHKWSKNFGQMQTRNGFGEGASPALHGDTIVVNWDDETENDFIVALDKNTGKELWRRPRNETTGWSTPLIVESGKKAQVIVNAKVIRSYDLATGTELWSCGGQTDNAIPSPVNDADTVYALSGFRGNSLLAIKLDAKGDITGSDSVRWSYNKSMPYVPSPLLAGDTLYAISGNTGKISAFDAKTGKVHFETQQLEGIFGIYASPVATKDRVYVLGREGRCVVLKKGSMPEVLASNKLDDKTDASIALVGRELFIRGHENLYCIAEK